MKFNFYLVHSRFSLAIIWLFKANHSIVSLSQVNNFYIFDKHTFYPFIQDSVNNLEQNKAKDKTLFHIIRTYLQNWLHSFWSTFIKYIIILYDGNVLFLSSDNDIFILRKQENIECFRQLLAITQWTEKKAGWKLNASSSATWLMCDCGQVTEPFCFPAPLKIKWGTWSRQCSRFLPAFLL